MVMGHTIAGEHFLYIHMGLVQWALVGMMLPSFLGSLAMAALPIDFSTPVCDVTPDIRARYTVNTLTNKCSGVCATKTVSEEVGYCVIAANGKMFNAYNKTSNDDNNLVLTDVKPLIGVQHVDALFQRSVYVLTSVILMVSHHVSLCSLSLNNLGILSLNKTFSGIEQSATGLYVPSCHYPIYIHLTLAISLEMR